MKSAIAIIFICAFGFSSLFAQSQYKGLDSLNNYNLKVYYSKGHGERAKEIARLSHNAIHYTAKLLDFTPKVSLLILSPSDWEQQTKMPYGMPHYTNSNTLIIASENNPLWRSFIPPLEQLPATLAEQVKKVYNKDGELTMQPFFDLLALHELGHAFHQQASLHMQRKWMGELFCNMVLHTFIAENEPQMLPALTVFPNMVVAGGAAGFTYTTLDQFEKHYNEIGRQHPKNYGWYQSRLHVAAREIYDAAGKEVLLKLWLALKENSAKDNQQLSKQLDTKVHPAVTQVMLQW
jgi:hypothetical protein